MLNILKKVSYIIRKIFCFGVLTVLSFPFSLIIAPLLLFIGRNDKRPDLKLRSMVSWAFRSILNMGKILGLLEITIINKEALNSDKELIICANHPTFIDVAALISMIPNADCIVKYSLIKNPVLGLIIKRLYILNSLTPEQTIQDCTKSLNSGHHFIHFLEGTRTDFTKEFKIKRSSAHVALVSKHKMLPVYIHVNETAGFGKGEKFFDTPKSGKLKIRIEFLSTIDPLDFTNPNKFIAARELTEKIKSDIIRAKKGYEQ